jgi:hypothetical protein
MPESTCYLCSQRFGIKSGWCNACDNYPENEFCPKFSPRIEMENAAIIYFRTGALPDDWHGIDVRDYYRVTDESTEAIEFDTSDRHYKIIKTTLRKLGINLDDIQTLDELSAIERDFLPEICDAMARQHKENSGSLDETYLNALSYWKNDEAKRLLHIIFERDHRGLNIVSSSDPEKL